MSLSLLSIFFFFLDAVQSKLMPHVRFDALFYFELSESEILDLEFESVSEENGLSGSSCVCINE